MLVGAQVFLVFQETHLVPDLLDKVGDAVRHRHIDRVSLLARKTALKQARLAATVGGKCPLGGGDEFPEQFDFGAEFLAAAKKDLDDFLEIEEPEGQAQIFQIDDIRLFAE